MDRKKYSKRREEALWRLVDKTVMDLRLAALRGELDGLGRTSKEDMLLKIIGNLPDSVAAEYRKSMVSNN